MSDKLEYENFIRAAFKYALKREIGRWGDPATLANTDYFEDRMLSRVKAAVAYSMEIFNAEIRESNNLTENDYHLMDQLLTSVINAPNTVTISNLIGQYKSSIYQKYIVGQQ
jgi:hypothetical protein